MSRSPDYRAYLLRCWTEQGHTSGQRGRWRFSVEDPRTARQRGFTSLAALVAFLASELANCGDQPSQDQVPAPPDDDGRA